MKIILDQKWFIEDDGKGYTLNKLNDEKNVDKNGKETDKYDYQTFPPTVVACVEKYVRMSLIDKNKEIELKAYLEAFNKKYKEVIEAINLIGITR